MVLVVLVLLLLRVLVLVLLVTLTTVKNVKRRAATIFSWMPVYGWMRHGIYDSVVRIIPVASGVLVVPKVPED